MRLLRIALSAAPEDTPIQAIALRLWPLRIDQILSPGASPLRSADVCCRLGLMPESHRIDALRAIILSRIDMNLSDGVGILEGRVFRARQFGD
jgi:hypothetical protein